MKRGRILFLAALMPSLTLAGDYQSLQSIRNAARAFVAAHYDSQNNYQNKNQSAVPEIVPGKLDPRLRLARCDQGLNASYSSNSRNASHLTVNIQCNGSQPWTLYVPVQVKMFQDVVVLAHSMPRNSVLSRSDLRLEKRDINKMTSGHFTDASEVLGKTLTRSVSGNLALNPVFVRSPMLVKRGDQVILLAQAGGITVKMSGKALANGAAGDRIQVKNLSSQRVIEGVITEEGLISTRM